MQPNLETGGTGIAGNIHNQVAEGTLVVTGWLVLKPLKPLFKTEDTLIGSRYELEPRATEQ